MVTCPKWNKRRHYHGVGETAKCEQRPGFVILFTAGTGAIILILLLVAFMIGESKNGVDLVNNGGKEIHYGGAERIQESTKLTIIHINDHHSHLEGGYIDIRVPPDVTNKNSTDSLRVHVGGYPRLVALMNILKAKYEATGNAVLKLHAGDAIVGTPYYTMFHRGGADADVMSNHACFDAFEIGNQEFNDGDEVLARFVENLNNRSSSCPITAVLGANIRPGPSSPLKRLVEDGQIRRSIVKTLTKGDSIGIVGIDARNTTMYNNPLDRGTILLDERQTAQTEIANLKQRGVNKIILLTHVGYKYDVEVMAQIDGVSTVVGGHSHTLLGNDSDLHLLAAPPGRDQNNKVTPAPYPTVIRRKSDGGTACVVQAYYNALCLGLLHVTFDPEGRVVSCHGKTLIPFDPSRFTVRTTNGEVKTLSAAEARIVVAHLESLGPNFVGTVEDEATAATMQKYASRVDALKDTVIAYVPEPICNERVPGEGRSKICSSESTKVHGGGVCNLVAKSLLRGALRNHSADIAIVHAGYCRTDIDNGNFTLYDANVLLPFPTNLFVLKVTGREVIHVLEDAIDFVVHGSFPSYPYASGLRYEVDLTAPRGTRLSNMQVNPRLEIDEWSPLDLDATYSVVTPRLLALGLAGYAEFGKVSHDRRDTRLDMTQKFIDYVRKDGVLYNLPIEEYSTQSYTSRLATSMAP